GRDLRRHRDCDRLHWRGRGRVRHLVYAGSEKRAHDHGDGHDHDHASGDDHSHDDGEDHDHYSEATQLQTDAKGELTMEVTHDGIWYLRTIHLVETEEDGLTHESNWATLTFEVAHSHGGGGHTHADGSHHADHDHEHAEAEGGIPLWIFGLMSLVVVGGLFLYFN
ncbi:MAG: hypothetical protein AAFN92_00780, partial [Bacteroidota bacterium]